MTSPRLAPQRTSHFPLSSRRRACANDRPGDYLVGLEGRRLYDYDQLMLLLPHAARPLRLLFEGVGAALAAAAESSAPSRQSTEGRSPLSKDPGYYNDRHHPERLQTAAPATAAVVKRGARGSDGGGDSGTDTGESSDTSGSSSSSGSESSGSSSEFSSHDSDGGASGESRGRSQDVVVVGAAAATAARSRRDGRGGGARLDDGREGDLTAATREGSEGRQHPSAEVTATAHGPGAVPGGIAESGVSKPGHASARGVGVDVAQPCVAGPRAGTAGGNGTGGAATAKSVENEYRAGSVGVSAAATELRAETQSTVVATTTSGNGMARNGHGNGHKTVVGGIQNMDLETSDREKAEAAAAEMREERGGLEDARVAPARALSVAGDIAATGSSASAGGTGESVPAAVRNKGQASGVAGDGGGRTVETVASGSDAAAPQSRSKSSSGSAGVKRTNKSKGKRKGGGQKRGEGSRKDVSKLSSEGRRADADLSEGTKVGLHAWSGVDTVQVESACARAYGLTGEQGVGTVL